MRGSPDVEKSRCEEQCRENERSGRGSRGRASGRRTPRGRTLPGGELVAQLDAWVMSLSLREARVTPPDGPGKICHCARGNDPQ
jgi:hypothetical protein